MKVTMHLNHKDCAYSQVFMKIFNVFPTISMFASVSLQPFMFYLSNKRLAI